MKVSKKAEYGLIAMLCLAKNKRIISIREISNTEGIPFEFLSKIFAKLEKTNLVEAKHGANGGYFLAKPARLISVAEIVQFLDGKLSPVNCSLCRKSRKCVSKSVWDKVKKALFETLDSITLASLIK